MTTGLTSSSLDLKIHIDENGRPLCGGGHQARRNTGWQTDIAQPNCERCLNIQKDRAEREKLKDSAFDLCQLSRSTGKLMSSGEWASAARVLSLIRTSAADLEKACRERSKALKSPPPEFEI